MSESLNQQIERLQKIFRSDLDPHGRAFVPLADAHRQLGDMDQALALVREGLQEHPDFRWFEGADALAAQSLLMGAHGLVNGGMNVFPGVYVSLYRAARSGDVPAVQREHQRLMRCLRLLRVDRAQSSPFGSFVKTTKYALQLMGICSEHLSLPFEPLGAESKRKVEQFLADLAE